MRAPYTYSYSFMLRRLIDFYSATNETFFFSKKRGLKKKNGKSSDVELFCSTHFALLRCSDRNRRNRRPASLQPWEIWPTLAPTLLLLIQLCEVRTYSWRLFLSATDSFLTYFVLTDFAAAARATTNYESLELEWTVSLTEVLENLKNAVPIT